MALVTATFLINDIKKTEKFVVNLPIDYVYQDGERLVSRQIQEDLYNRLLANKDNQLKIFRYVEDTSIYSDLTIPPKGLDYKIGLTTRLHHKPSFSDRGLLTKMEFYSEASYDPENKEIAFNDLILYVDFDYLIDENTHFVIKRDKTITWITEAETECEDKKTMNKWYSAMEMDAEIIQRRTNFISILKLEVANFLAWLFSVQYPDESTRPSSNNASKEIIKALNIPILNYINGGDKSIAGIIDSQTNPIFNVTMPDHGVSLKEYLVNKIETHG